LPRWRSTGFSAKGSLRTVSVKIHGQDVLQALDRGQGCLLL
jgi:hypothetical protein